MIVAADHRGIEAAARALARGELVAMPTETVYGLAADAARGDAVARIYAVKGRPAGHPLIVHVTGLAAAREWGRFDAAATALATAFWPGPLTLIVPRRPEAPAWACGDAQGTIGLRVPSHPVARELLAHFAALGGRGVAAPSANRFGRVSPTRAEHVRDDLGEDAPLILDGGEAPVGVESTIVDLSRGRAVLLRPGAVTRSMLAAALGAPVAERDEAAPAAPGTLAAHYAPRARLELCAADALAGRVAAVRAGSAGDRACDDPSRVAVWSFAPPADRLGGWVAQPRDPQAAAHALYGTLRAFDDAGMRAVLVECVPSQEAWSAVADRLARAAVGSAHLPESS